MANRHTARGPRTAPERTPVAGALEAVAQPCVAPPLVAQPLVAQPLVTGPCLDEIARRSVEHCESRAKRRESLTEHRESRAPGAPAPHARAT